MVRLDFWNNPLVVSAFRVKYRRGGLFHVTALYLLLLVLVGAVLTYYGDRIVNKNVPPRRSVEQLYFLIVMGLQCVVSPVMAAVATQASMKTEVINRTLDFQRIAALSPRQILLGKLLGEPALAYLLIVATVPLTVYCWAAGVPGLTLVELGLLYLHLFTTTVLFGCVGLLNKVEVTEGKLTGGGAAGGALWAWLMMSVWLALGQGVATLFGGGGRVVVTQWYLVPAGLLTPLLPMFGMARENAWAFVAPLYGAQVPLLLVTPFVQVFVACLCFQTMVRRLVNPLNTTMHRALAYLTLVVVDAAAAGVLYDPLRDSLAPLAGAFWVVHLTAALTLVAAVTPWRESLHSWVWRYRGRRNLLLDLWLGARSPNGLVLVTFAMIGVVSLAALLVVPLGTAKGWDFVRESGADLAGATALTVLLLLTLGTLYQWFDLVAGRSGSGALLSLSAAFFLLPHLAGRYYEVPLLLALSPTAHYLKWTAPDSPLNLPGPLPLWPALGLYGLVFAAAGLHLRSLLHRLERSVDAKLRQMGVAAVR